jgi:predicted ABC-type ATPase
VRPRLYVLAGVNGAGKSSLLGRGLSDTGQAWFNPDAYAMDIMGREGCDWPTANLRAGIEGIRRFRAALSNRRDYAFETTLGGRTMVRKLMAAATSHEVVMWFCGLSSVDLHIARVCARVTQGGHAIAEAQIRERYVTVPRNLITLLPHLTHLQVYDNSDSVPLGLPVPDPRLVLHLASSALLFPHADDLHELQQTPPWAIPIVEAALQLHERRPTDSRST